MGWSNAVARLAETLAADPDRLLFTGPGESLTRGEFQARVVARQAQLQALLPAVPRVMVAGGRGLQFWVDAVAVWGIGGAFIPVSPAMPEDQAAVIIADARPNALIGAVDCLEGAAGITAITEIPAPAQGTILARGAEADLSSVLFTSGSSGRPKGVALSHKSLLGNASAFLDALAPDAGDRLFFAIPFHFTSALSHFLVMAMAGCEIVATEQKLFLADLFNAVRQSGATCFGGSPLQLRWLAECAAKEPLALRWAMSSGDHLSVKVIDLLRTSMPDTAIVTVYGLTELGGRFCMLPPALIDAHKGAVGRPIAGLGVTIVGDDGQALPQGEIGEIFANGQWLLDEYINNPGATAEALRPEGFRTGDLGWLSPEGLLHVAGRADDVFKCHGEKVAAQPILDALLETGLFQDAAVVGFEDPYLGTVPKVLYVPKDDQPVNIMAVTKRLRALLPPAHVPRKFAQVPAIPRTGSGKIKRVELRQLADNC